MARKIPPVTDIDITGDVLRKLLGDNPSLILEIGAHHGQHTMAFLQLFPQVRMHSFEPDPRAIAVHRRMVRNPRSTLHEFAIGAADGQATFHMSDGLPPGPVDLLRANYPNGWDQSGSLHKPTGHVRAHPWCTFNRTITVEVRTLDSWASVHAPGQIDLIWADMQGAEGSLATGGPQALARTRFIYCEYSNEELYEGEPTLERLLDMMPAFEVVYRLPGDVVLRNTALVG